MHTSDNSLNNSKFSLIGQEPTTDTTKLFIKTIFSKSKNSEKYQRISHLNKANEYFSLQNPSETK